MSRTEQMPQPEADIGQDPYFRQILRVANIEPRAIIQLTACANQWHSRQMDPGQRIAPGVGLSNAKLLDLAAAAGVAGDPEKLVDFARAVLSAATRRRGPLIAPPRPALVLQGNQAEDEPT